MTTTASHNTRQRLIDVARQLFISNGLENTTMNDIATASDKGRRTIYTYFRTQKEIYEAVIEDESTRVRQMLRREVDAMSSPDLKLRRLMELRIDLASRSVNHPEVWFRSLFSRDRDRAVRIRNMVRDSIYEMIGEIVDDGVKRHVFNAAQARRLKPLLTVLVQGCDWEMMRDNEARPVPPSERRLFIETLDFVIDGLLTASPNCENPLTN